MLWKQKRNTREGQGGGGSRVVFLKGCCLCYYCWTIIFYLVSSGKGSLTPYFSLLLCACALLYFHLIRTQKSKRESVSKLQLVSLSTCIREQTPPFLVLRAGTTCIVDLSFWFVSRSRSCGCSLLFVTTCCSFSPSLRCPNVLSQAVRRSVVLSRPL